MIVFKKIRWKNFLSTGNIFTEIELNKSATTLIVGENGAGKSTLLKLIAGIERPRLQPTRLLQTAVFLAAGQLGVALVPESFRRHLPVNGCVYRDVAGPQTYTDLIALWRRDEVPAVLARLLQELRRMAKAHKLQSKAKPT